MLRHGSPSRLIQFNTMQWKTVLSLFFTIIWESHASQEVSPCRWTDFMGFGVQRLEGLQRHKQVDIICRTVRPSFLEWDPRWLVGIQRHVYQSESILDGPFHWWLSKEKHWHWLFGLKKCVHWSELSLISWMGLEWILIVACFPDCRLHHLFLSLWGLPYSQLVWQSRPHKTFISMKIGTWSQLLF